MKNHLDPDVPKPRKTSRDYLNPDSGSPNRNPGNSGKPITTPATTPDFPTARGTGPAGNTTVVDLPNEQVPMPTPATGGRDPRMNQR